MVDTQARVLLVEDDLQLRLALSVLLTESGYSVTAAGDGVSALDELEGALPDVILSDLNMPRMSGFELLSLVRRKFPMIPLIAMSGAFSGNLIPPGVTADAFYAKGTNPNGLLEIVNAVAHRAHADLEAPCWLAAPPAVMPIADAP
jgi:CheY-like chemotaxis protein